MKNDELPDLKQLSTFVATVDHGSLTAAGRALDISQPAVSQQLKRLEAWIGSPIFVRNGAISKLTPDGEALLVFSRAIVGMSAQACAHFRDAGPQRRVRLGLTETFALTTVPRVLGFFSRMHADFELVVETSFETAKLFEALDDDCLDLVVTKTSVTETRGDVLEIVPLVWVGQAADMRLPEGPVPLVAVRGARLAADLIMAALTEAGRAWTIRFSSQNLAALDAAVSSGLGVSAAMRGIKTGSAVPLDKDCGLPALGEVALCLDVGGRAVSPAVAAFAAFFKQVVAELDLGGRHGAVTVEMP